MLPYGILKHLEAAENPEQAALTLLGIQDIVVLAPAGCGKTEALAHRARALLAGRVVVPPRRILALTFSNRAKSNLATRLRSAIGPNYRRSVTVTNFHGFAARLIRAHGNQIDLDPAVALPERGWQARTFRELGIDWRSATAVEVALRRAKSDDASDDTVLERLSEFGVQPAIHFEQRLRQEGRLDFADLLRHGERLLGIPQVRRLYREHFGAVVVDEIQDLTQQQLRIVQAVGADRLTAAGDVTQGIYGFAGAEPEQVLALLNSASPAIVEFRRSYRSSPAVLEAVNCVARELGGIELAVARPESWQDPGTVAVVRRRTPTQEAEVVLERVAGLLNGDSELSVGVLARRGTRRHSLEEAARLDGRDYEAWDSPTHNASILALLRKALPDAMSIGKDPFDRVDVLEQLCKASLLEEDVEGRDGIALACETLRNAVGEGTGIEEAVARCRNALPHDSPVPAGLHLLNGHLGKGQQFDWVFVLGLEQSHIPDFRAQTPEALEEELRVLHVMVSRARYGLVVTCVERTQDRYGTWHPQDESPWMHLLEAAKTTDW